MLVSFRTCLQHTGRTIRRCGIPWSFLSRSFFQPLFFRRRPSGNSIVSSRSNSNNFRSSRCRATFAKSAVKFISRGTLCGGTSSMSVARVPGFSVRIVATERNNGLTCTPTSNTGITVSRFTQSISRRINNCKHFVYSALFDAKL